MGKKKLIEMLDGAIDLEKITVGGEGAEPGDDTMMLESCTEVVEWGSDRICYNEPGDTKYAGYKVIPRPI